MCGEVTRSEASSAREATMARPSSERERLTQLIQQWNVDHYDLFELSAPNQVRMDRYFCALKFFSLSWWQGALIGHCVKG